MAIKRVGWCRLSEELVLDTMILRIPYLRDDMDVYQYDGVHWFRWTPELQSYECVKPDKIPDVVKFAMVMIE